MRRCVRPRPAKTRNRDGGTSKHLACGDGHVDVPASLGTLAQGGFDGWIMIDAWEIPDPYDACAKGKKAIDRAMALFAGSKNFPRNFQID